MSEVRDISIGNFLETTVVGDDPSEPIFSNRIEINWKQIEKVKKFSFSDIDLDGNQGDQSTAIKLEKKETGFQVALDFSYKLNEEISNHTIVPDQLYISTDEDPYIEEIRIIKKDGDIVKYLDTDDDNLLESAVWISSDDTPLRKVYFTPSEVFNPDLVYFRADSGRNTYKFGSVLSVGNLPDMMIAKEEGKYVVDVDGEGYKDENGDLIVSLDEMTQESQDVLGFNVDLTNFEQNSEIRFFKENKFGDITEEIVYEDTLYSLQEIKNEKEHYFLENMGRAGFIIGIGLLVAGALAPERKKEKI